MSTILIVDDIEENLYLLRVLLEGRGYAVEDARNGSEALVKALARPPYLIITDILMPVIDGFTLCRIWKSDERLSKIPFVFYTATYTDPRDKHLALDMGADAFIVKPTEPEEFLSMVENILMNSREGKLVPPQKPRTGEETILTSYNEALIRKLEDKMLSLGKSNRELEAQIESRVKAEEQIARSLQEKDALLRELHHRVKNNLQIISSMISLQEKYFFDDKDRILLRDINSRILSMALVHEKLYQNETFSLINFSDHLDQLINDLISMYTYPKQDIIFKKNIDGIEMDINYAIPCSQIITELIANALKHAFPEGRKGEITVNFTKKENQHYILNIRDNGVGFPENFEFPGEDSLGLTMVTVMVKQIKGSLEVIRNNGVEYIITFNTREKLKTITGEMDT